MTISEAQFYRRPVVCSGIGGMAEMVRDGHNGLHARPGDATDTGVKKIQTLPSDRPSAK